jgi:hypothetical protein
MLRARSFRRRDVSARPFFRPFGTGEYNGRREDGTRSTCASSGKWTRSISTPEGVPPSAAAPEFFLFFTLHVAKRHTRHVLRQQQLNGTSSSHTSGRSK